MIGVRRYRLDVETSKGSAGNYTLRYWREPDGDGEAPRDAVLPAGREAGRRGMRSRARDGPGAGTARSGGRASAVSAAGMPGIETSVKTWGTVANRRGLTVERYRLETAVNHGGAAAPQTNGRGRVGYGLSLLPEEVFDAWDAVYPRPPSKRQVLLLRFLISLAGGDAIASNLRCAPVGVDALAHVKAMWNQRTRDSPS